MDVYADPPVGAGPPATVSEVTTAELNHGGDRMRPDVTKVQIIALAQTVIGLLVAFGVEMTPDQQDAILELVGQLGVALILGDAGLRGMRNLSDRR